MAWCVDKVVRVRAPYMASPVILEDCRELNGCVFFHLKKSCDVVMKLLGHPRSKGSRPLVNTSICETWSALEMTHTDRHCLPPWTSLTFTEWRRHPYRRLAPEHGRNDSGRTTTIFKAPQRRYTVRPWATSRASLSRSLSTGLVPPCMCSWRRTP